MTGSGVTGDLSLYFQIANTTLWTTATVIYSGSIGYGPQDAVLGDLNGDGQIDIAAIDGPGAGPYTLRAHLNGGQVTITFLTTSNVLVSPHFRALRFVLGAELDNS